jgi:hypothetical protein
MCMIVQEIGAASLGTTSIQSKCVTYAHLNHMYVYMFMNVWQKTAYTTH